MKDIGIYKTDNLCDDLNMEGAQCNFKDVNEIIDSSQNVVGYQHEDGGLDCILMEKNISVTGSDTLIHNTMEVVNQFIVSFIILISSYMQP